MPRWWVLSQTPANNGRVSRNVRMISSPHSRPWRGAKRFLRLVSLSRSRKTDALEKHTPNQRLSICVLHKCATSSCFQHALWKREEVQRRVSQHHNSYTHFPQMKARNPDADQSLGSLQGLCDPPRCGYSIQPISCHRIIVFKWSAHWQMMCDQFYNNATCLPWEMESWDFIQLEDEWTCCEELKVTDTEIDQCSSLYIDTCIWW